MARVKALRGLISQKYDSEAALARNLGWSRQKLNQITSGKKEPNIYEAQAIADGLEVSINWIANIFLQHKSPNEQQEVIIDHPA